MRQSGPDKESLSRIELAGGRNYAARNESGDDALVRHLSDAANRETWERSERRHVVFIHRRGSLD